MRTYFWSRLIAVARPAGSVTLLVAGILLARADWLPAGIVGPLQAASLLAVATLAAAAVGGASCMAGHAYSAMALGRAWRRVYVPALLFAAIYASVGAWGIHVGYLVVVGETLNLATLVPAHLVTTVGVFLALGKIAFAFTLEGRADVDRELERRADERIRLEAREREQRLTPQVARFEAPQSRLGRGLRYASAAALMASAPLASVAAPPVAAIAEPHHGDNQRARFQALLAETGTVRAAARAAGISERTAFRWLAAREGARAA